MTVQTKNPVKVRAGIAGAKARWGEQPRTIRLTDYDADTARLIRILVANAAKAAESEGRP